MIVLGIHFLTLPVSHTHGSNRYLVFVVGDAVRVLYGALVVLASDHKRGAFTTSMAQRSLASKRVPSEFTDVFAGPTTEPHTVFKLSLLGF